MSEEKKIDKRKQGRRNKANGAAWELKVRKDLERLGWKVSKFQNNIDLETKTMIPARRKYNPFNRAFSVGTGFPDFIAWKEGDVADIETEAFNIDIPSTYSTIGIEAKSNGSLTKLEKDKCLFLLENNVFSNIFIAKKMKEGRRVVPEYIDFRERYIK